MRHTFAPIALVGLLTLAGCATAPPTSINDVCAVFSQREGFMGGWHDEARRAEKKHGIPVHVLMATMRVESAFDHDARPVGKRRFFGLLPGKRMSSAFGYSQALDGTWKQYRDETGRRSARRTNFTDSIDFIGWYYAKTVAKFQVPPDDAYALYLSYHSGWTGFARGVYRERPVALNAATRVANTASAYRAQLSGCR